MKQIFLKRGSVVLEEVPAQLINENSLRIGVEYSLISAGTEISGLEQSGVGLVNRALRNPSDFGKIIDRAFTDGISSTIESVKARRYAMIPAGYSLAGVATGVGENVDAFRVGDRVACSGSGIACHAQVAVVPKNLAVRIPEGCRTRDASSVAIGAIALQGVRRAEVRIGENVVVLGLGLVGQLTAQILRVSGCRVIGIDPDEERLETALKLGLYRAFKSADAATIKKIYALTSNLGADSTIICAASKSDEIAQSAMELTRKKGKVVIVGDVGLGLKRKPFYHKEIDLLISCSCGPGRYDRRYELEGIDYPRPYVRWTENENMKEYLRLIAEKRLDLAPLLGHEYPFEQCALAYDALGSKTSRPMGVVLRYDTREEAGNKDAGEVRIHRVIKKNGIGLAVIGAGSFASSVHLPNIRKLGGLYGSLALAGRSGGNLCPVGKRFGASFVSTDYRRVLNDPATDAVMICTRHNLHAKMAVEALRSGKAVFVEKPMAMDETGLNQLVSVYRSLNPQPVFMMGYNRRFSPAAVALKKRLERRDGPVQVLYRVKSNQTPPDHWVQTEEGGGRIIGEACHMVDLFGFFTGSPVVSIDAEAVSADRTEYPCTDNFTATLRYEDGSVCTLFYTTQGARNTPKEFIEVFCGEETLVIHDFKELRSYGRPRVLWSSRKGDKGHLEELKAFARYITGEERQACSFDQMVETARVTFEIDRMVRGR